MSCATTAVARRWALRGYPATTAWPRRGMYHALPFLIHMGQLNIASGEKVGTIAVWRTRPGAARAKRQGVRRIVKKLEIVRVVVSVEVLEKS